MRRTPLWRNNSLGDLYEFSYGDSAEAGTSKGLDFPAVSDTGNGNHSAMMKNSDRDHRRRPSAAAGDIIVVSTHLPPVRAEPSTSNQAHFLSNLTAQSAKTKFPNSKSPNSKSFHRRPRPAANHISRACLPPRTGELRFPRYITRRISVTCTRSLSWT